MQNEIASLRLGQISTAHPPRMRTKMTRKRIEHRRSSSNGNERKYERQNLKKNARRKSSDV
jgi:hypothetical protein